MIVGVVPFYITPEAIPKKQIRMSHSPVTYLNSWRKLFYATPTSISSNVTFTSLIENYLITLINCQFTTTVSSKSCI